MKFRLNILIVLSVALAVAAAVLVLAPAGVGGNQALPQPVPAGDQEIAWLNAEALGLCIGNGSRLDPSSDVVKRYAYEFCRLRSRKLR